MTRKAANGHLASIDLAPITQLEDLNNENSRPFRHSLRHHFNLNYLHFH